MDFSDADNPNHPRSARDEAIGLAVGYVALYFMVGIHLPFFPLWLGHRGATTEQVGWLLGVGNWARLAAPWVGAWADRYGSGTRLLLLVSVGMLATLYGFGWAWGFGPLLALSLINGLLYAPIIPLLDGLTLHAAAAGRLDYGRVRLWGSVAFIVASAVGGSSLDGRGRELILTTLQIGAVAMVAAAWWLARVASTPKLSLAPTVSWSQVWSRPGFVRFLICAAFLQGAHGVLYGFGSKYWIGIGIDGTTVGWFWATGVVAEIVLFAAGARLAAKVGPARLLLVAGIGGVVRWSLIGLVVSVPGIFALQLLHAASFGALHLGAMGWIRVHMAGPTLHRATGLYIAVASGFALGLGMPLAGFLFASWGRDAYAIMAVLAGLGTTFAWGLTRLQTGERD